VVTNEVFAEKAAIIREKGTNRQNFLLGLVDKYTWVDVGSSYLLSDLLAAFLLSQLEAVERITARRRRIYETYREELQGLADAGKLRLPRIPPECESNYHLFYVLFPSESIRNHVMESLKKDGTQAVFHYVPLHSSPMGARFGYQEGDLPTTENVSRCILRLPMFASLTATAQRRVIRTLKKCL
jgi:dTDP-4-amino-4,6-dideoxygalactose transaminase